MRPGKQDGWTDGWREREIRKSSSFYDSSLRKLPVIQKEHYSGSFPFQAFSACMFADCLITSLGFGTRTLQIHDHPSHYLHIFPLRIIIALTTAAHVLMSCRPGHTEVIIFWKWPWWASAVCTIGNQQDEAGRFPSPPLLRRSKITFPLFLHSATQDTAMVYVLWDVS